MVLQDATSRCNKCKKDFATQLLVKCTVDAFCALIKTMKCPHCGAGYKHLALVTTKDTDDNGPTVPENQSRE